MACWQHQLAGLRWRKSVYHPLLYLAVTTLPHSYTIILTRQQSGFELHLGYMEMLPAASRQQPATSYHSITPVQMHKPPAASTSHTTPPPCTALHNRYWGIHGDKDIHCQALAEDEAAARAAAPDVSGLALLPLLPGHNHAADVAGWRGLLLRLSYDGDVAVQPVARVLGNKGMMQMGVGGRVLGAARGAVHLQHGLQHQSQHGLLPPQLPDVVMPDGGAAGTSASGPLLQALPNGDIVKVGGWVAGWRMAGCEDSWV